MKSSSNIESESGRRFLVAMGDIPPIHPDAIELLRKAGEVDVPTHLLPEDELVDRIKGVTAVFLGAPKLTRRVIQSADRLQIIARCGTGVDNIDIQTASERGVVVTNLLSMLARTVAEHTVLFMLAVTRELVVADRSVRTGHWKDFARIGHPEIYGKTLGIVGLGSIGGEVAEMARKAFHMRILTNENPHLKPDRVRKAAARVVPMEELLATSDYVVLSVPLTEETEKMIGEKELGTMKRTSYLINVARGKIVDQDALYRALKEERIAGAALDVLAKQPPDPGDPLMALDNVVFTPHCAAITNETGREASLLIVRAALDLLRGKLPRYPVNLLNPVVARKFVRNNQSRIDGMGI